MVNKHNNDEEAEENGAEASDGRPDDLRRRRKDAAVFVHAADALPNHEDESVHGAKEDVDEELEEELLIVVADAVVDPRAVMVHAGDAALTD